MMEKHAEEARGLDARSEVSRGYRRGRTQGKIGFHAGKVAVERPRVRDLAGQELALRSWDRAIAEDWLGKWAMNLMLINVATRKFRRAVRLPEATFRRRRGPACRVGGVATLRGAVGCTHEGMDERGSVWARHHGGDIHDIHISEYLVLVAALGIDSEGIRHLLGLMEGATHRPWSGR